MSLYAIGDLHLSLGVNKSMDVFGGRWENYVEKIRDSFSTLGDDDLTVLCGDITWGMTMDEALHAEETLCAGPIRRFSQNGEVPGFLLERMTTALKADVENQRTVSAVAPGALSQAQAALEAFSADPAGWCANHF